MPDELMQVIWMIVGTVGTGLATWLTTMIRLVKQDNKLEVNSYKNHYGSSSISVSNIC